MPEIILPPTPPQQDQPGLRQHFGRLKRWDCESANHLIRGNRLNFWRSLTARVRSHVNWRVWWQGNQGATSQCGAYSALGAWEAGKGHPRGAKHPLHGFPRPIMKPDVVYDEAQNDDEWPGSEKVDPKYEGTSATGAAAAMKKFGLIKGYDWEFQDIEVCERAIFTAPLIFGIDWKIGMMLDGAPRTRLEDALVKNVGGVIGGHLIACIGYDKRRKGAEFELLNSWGRDWGFEGRCLISRDDLGALLADQGECVLYDTGDDKDIAAALDAGRR